MSADWFVEDSTTGDALGIYRAATAEEAVAVCAINRKLEGRTLRASPAPPGAWEEQSARLGHAAVERYRAHQRLLNSRKN